MKVLEIILLILIIIIIYPGIDYLKSSAEKIRRDGNGGGAPPSTFKGTDYYNPKPVWSINSDNTFKFQGTCVLGSGICRVYTYEQPLVSQKTDSNGNFNLLSNVSYVRPNLNTALEDFVNGNSHLTGKIKDIEKDASKQCIDPDQINTKYVTKTCLENNKKGSLNKCFDNQGNVIEAGKNFSYNLECSDKICDGEIGCISLNYNDSGGNIPINTQCISIKQISIPSSLENVFNLDFYNLLGIIHKDDSIGVSGPYPVVLGFAPCDNTDAKQKFKILRFTGLGSSAGVCTNLNHTLKQDDQGSYASLIFRGINSYLDSDNGNFVLKPIPDSGVSQTVKWIFFPEAKVTDNLIPSTQRCIALKSNIYSDPSIMIASDLAKSKIGAGPGVVVGAGGTAVWGGVTGAKAIGRGAVAVGRGLKRLAQAGKYVVRSIKNATGFNGSSENAEDPEETEMEDFSPGGGDEGGTGEETGDSIAESAADTGGDAAAEAAGEAAGEGAAEGAAAAGAEGAVAGLGAQLGGALAGLASLVEILGPVFLLLLVLSLIFSFLPDPTYSQKYPIGLEGAFSKGQRVSPTDFAGDITATGPGSKGLAPVTPLEHFCVQRKLDQYPPYFLEALSDGTGIDLNLFFYEYSVGYHISGRKVLSFGTAPSAYGLWIYTKPEGVTDGPPVAGEGVTFQDGDTTWFVKKPLSESVIYPKSYFTDDKSSSVFIGIPEAGSATTEMGFSPVNKQAAQPGAVPPDHNTVDVFSYLWTSRTGLIKTLDTSSKTTKEELENKTRFSGDYVNIIDYSLRDKKGTETTPNPPNTIPPLTTPGAYAEFNVVVSSYPVSPVDFESKISSVTLSNPGINFNPGDTVIIPQTSIGGTSTGTSLTLGVSTVATETFIFKAASCYKDNNDNGNLTYFFPEYEPPPNRYTFVNGGFETIAAYDGQNNISFETDTDNSFFQPIGPISGGTGYKVGDPMYLIQYGFNNFNLQNPNASGGTGAVDYVLRTDIFLTPGSFTQVDITKCLQLQVTKLQPSGYEYNDIAPGSLLGTDTTSSNFYLEYNFMDNAENTFNSCPQQIVYGGSSFSGGGNLISELSSKIKGNIKEKDIQAIFLSKETRDSATGVLFEANKSVLNLKSLQVNRLGYRSVDLSDMGSIVQEDITNAIVSLKRFIPYSSFTPAYPEKDKKDELGFINQINRSGDNTPVLMYGVSRYFYNQNYAQIIPYGIPDVYNNAVFIENAPKF